MACVDQQRLRVCVQHQPMACVDQQRLRVCVQHQPDPWHARPVYDSFSKLGFVGPLGYFFVALFA